MAIDTTRALIAQITNASQVGENTAARVGGAMDSILDDVANANDVINKLAIDGKPLTLNSVIHDTYPKSTGVLASLSTVHTYVYDLSGVEFLRLTWGAANSNVNYAVFFGNDATFATVDSYIKPYTTTAGTTIIQVPSGAAYVAFSLGSLTQVDNSYKFDKIVDAVDDIQEGFADYTQLTFLQTQYGYLRNNGVLTGTSGTTWKMYLYSVSEGDKFYIQQPNLGTAYAFYGFFSSSTLSGNRLMHVPSNDGLKHLITVPPGATVLVINAGESSNWGTTAPKNIQMLGTPKMVVTEDVADFVSGNKNVPTAGTIADYMDKPTTEVYNYNRSYLLDKNKLTFSDYPTRFYGISSSSSGVTLNDIKSGDDFKSFGALNFMQLDLLSQRTIFHIHKAFFANRPFATSGKMRISFNYKSLSGAKNFQVKLYVWGASPNNYASATIAASDSEVGTFDYTFTVPTANISSINYIEVYLFKVGSPSTIDIKIANLIITDDIYDVAPAQRFSGDYLTAFMHPNDYIGKRCLYIGDSISTANNYEWKQMLETTYQLCWVRDKSTQLAPANGGITVRPLQADESSLANSAKSIWYRCAGARMNIYSFDIISLFGGTNDLNSYTAIGATTDKPYVDDASTFDTPANYTDTWTNALTFAQCLMGCIEMLQRDFPNNEIILATPYPMSYGTATDPDTNLPKSETIAQMIVKIGYKYGLKVVPFYWGIFTQSVYGAFTRDGVHPNDVLARQMAIKYAQVLGY